MPLSEDFFIQKYFAPLSASAPAARGLRDDAALVGYDGSAHCVVTTDMIVAGVHFFADDEPENIGWKALAVNVSDLIASGGRPRHYLLSIALSGSINEDWIARFASGLGQAQDRFGLSLIGGDTTRGEGRLAISITAMADIPPDVYTGRDGARPGDLIYVSGTIGDGFLGCALCQDVTRSEAWKLSAGQRDFLLDRYRRPQPRLEMTDAVRRFATASMDISDGLILDLERLCSASACGAAITAEEVPLSDAARSAVSARPDLFEGLLTGGDDYELLMAVASENSAAFEADARARGVAVTRIGVCGDGVGQVECRAANGEAMIFEQSGYDHFARKGQ